MAAIPVGEAAFAGFGVIRRNPLAVLVWGLALFVLAMLPMAGVFAIMVPWMDEFVRLAHSGGEPDTSAFLAMHMQLMALNPVVMLGSLASRVLLTCAIFRAVLTPQDSRFFYLRLGMAELLVALVYLCFVILLGLLFVAGLGVALGFGAALWGASKGLAVGMGLLIVLVLTVVAIWLSLRLSMAMPMTLAERKFRFFESWELTRGHTLSLFLVGLLAVVIVWLVELAIMALTVAAVAPFVAAWPLDEAALEAFFSRPPSEWMAALAPWLLVGGLVYSVAAAVLYALFTAPWAAAYRALVSPPPAAITPQETPA